VQFGGWFYQHFEETYWSKIFKYSVLFGLLFVIIDVLKDRNSFILFGVLYWYFPLYNTPDFLARLFFFACLTMKMKTLRYFETSITVRPTKECHIP